MNQDLFDIFLSDRFSLHITRAQAGEIIDGVLTSKSKPETSVPIKKGIPRFVDCRNYAENFGIQWNRYKSTQLDSRSGLSLTSDRFWKSTKWNPNDLRGKTILEVGSGAGRFTEILLNAGASVVSFDYSTAVDACYENNAHKGNLLLFQGDLYDIPFPNGYFDYVFCFGVLQHTPDPEKAYNAIYAKTKPGGRLSIDYYLKFELPSPWSTPKYLWRPITTRINARLLLALVKFYVPLWIPIDTLLRRIPRYGELIVALTPIPCWNYLGMGLSKKQRQEWAIMDTYDALGAKYDYPKTLREVQQLVENVENEISEVFYGSNGIVANVKKRP
jgi:SAM-dependent methyltransferase